MESSYTHKAERLISRLDAFERNPEEFMLVDSLVAEAKRRLRRGAKHQSREAQAVSNRLCQRQLALIYRLEMDEELEGLYDLHELKEELLDFLGEWIAAYPGFNRDNFDPQPSLKVDHVVDNYPAFADLLIRDKAIRIRFFKWAVRDSNQVDPFVLFPSLVEDLVRSNLSQRTGFYKGRHLVIHRDRNYDQNLICWLGLPFQGKEVNIAKKEEKVVLSDQQTRTVEEVFKVFENKRHTPGDVEFLEEGIIYFPSYESWKVFDLEDPEFYKKGPILERLSVDEVQTRYGKTTPGLDLVRKEVSVNDLIERGEHLFFEHPYSLLNLVEVIEDRGETKVVKMRERIPVDGENDLMVIRATSERPMSLLRTHAFSDTYMGMGDHYLHFNDGKYPQRYPESTIRLLLDFVRTVIAALQIYDDNLWFNHRNHVGECFGLTPGEGRVLMEIKRFLLTLARDDKLGFEFQAEGCAKMQQVDVFKLLVLLQNESEEELEKLEKKVRNLLYSKELEQFDVETMPNFFKTTLYKVSPEGFLGALYSFIKLFPMKVQPTLVTISYLFFGAWKGMKVRLGERDVDLTHLNSICWYDPHNPYGHSLYHPAFLHEQQKEVGITLLERKLHHLENDERIYTRLLKLPETSKKAA